MTFFLKRIVDAVIGTRPPDTAADDALEQLRQANRLVTQYRKEKTRRISTGNIAADMATGTYRPAKRSER